MPSTKTPGTLYRLQLTLALIVAIPTFGFIAIVGGVAWYANNQASQAKADSHSQCVAANAGRVNGNLTVRQPLRDMANEIAALIAASPTASSTTAQRDTAKRLAATFRGYAAQVHDLPLLNCGQR